MSNLRNKWRDLCSWVDWNPEVVTHEQVDMLMGLIMSLPGQNRSDFFQQFDVQNSDGSIKTFDQVHLEVRSFIPQSRVQRMKSCVNKLQAIMGRAFTVNLSLSVMKANAGEFDRYIALMEHAVSMAQSGASAQEINDTFSA